MNSLPKEIISSAFIADGGEYAWHSSHIFIALQAILITDRAILGGDVWTIENGKICSLFPEVKGIRM